MSARRQWQTLKALSPRERLWHIWEFCRWGILGAVFAAVLLTALIVTLCTRPTYPLFRGAVANLTVSEAGEQCLTQALVEPLGGGDDPEAWVELVTSTVVPEAENPQYYQAENMAVTALVMNRMVDYFLMDTLSMEVYSAQGNFMDLNRVLTPEQLAKVDSEKLIWCADEEGNQVPAVIDITDTLFAQHCVTGSEKVYIAFPGNTGRDAQIVWFFDYLWGWEPR